MIKHAKTTLLEPYVEYAKFIKKCMTKSYDPELVLHRHHIVPAFMDTARAFTKETVLVSVDDHIEAHKLLANCYEEGTVEWLGNLRSLKLLSKKSLKYRSELEKIYEFQKGDLNPAKRPENRLKISKGLKEHYKLVNSSRKGKTYDELYGERAQEEKLKRKKCTRSKSEYKHSGEKASRKLKGRVPHNAQPVFFENQLYRSLSEASRETGISVYKLKQQVNEK
jgi:hypothetical protein